MTTTTCKQCSRCKRTLPGTSFAAHKYTSDGLQAWCRQCKATDMRLRRAREQT